MTWASFAVRGASPDENVRRLAERVGEHLGDGPVDLAILFVTPHFAQTFDRLPELLHRYLRTRCLIGCSGSGVVGGGIEIENEPAFSLSAAHLPGVRIRAAHTDTEDLPDEDASPDVWRQWLGLAREPEAHFIVLADPYSSRVEAFLNGLDYVYPAGAKIGGLASGAREKGGHAVFVNDQCFRRGLAYVALSGDLEVDAVVAQGCRPIGEPRTITRCSQNLLTEVNGESPLKYLGRLVEQLGEGDRNLMRTSLFLGLEADAPLTGHAHADYLIRNLVGIDYQNGVLAVGGLLREGQVVQFHLRDKVTSAEDIDRLLGRYAAGDSAARVRGALMFSCIGRGQSLFGEPSHDASCFLQKLGPLPLGGFFCGGEIGPVGGTTYVHGYTSSFGLFRAKT